MFGRTLKKSFSSSNEPHHGRKMQSQLNLGDIMMHDVNIKEKIKTKCQIFSLVTLL